MTGPYRRRLPAIAAALVVAHILASSSTMLGGASVRSSTSRVRPDEAAP